jgi:hypothetical protein
MVTGRRVARDLMPGAGRRHRLHEYCSGLGRELFYWGRGGGQLMVTSMPAAGPTSLGPAVPVPGHHASNMTALSPLNYDITPDGLEFVLTRHHSTGRPN